MSNLRGHFGGTVQSMDERNAVIRIDNIMNGAWKAAKGDIVTALRADFMKQMPMPSVGSYVEGNVVHDEKAKQDRFINIVRPV